MNTLWGDTTKPFSIFCLPFQWWSTLRKKKICSYWRKILSFLCVDTIFRRASTSWEDTGIHQKCSPLWKWKQHLEAYPFILSEIISESSPKNNSSSKVHNITVWQLTQLFKISGYMVQLLTWQSCDRPWHHIHSNSNYKQMHYTSTHSGLGGGCPNK